jgi:hypothetical protein
LAVGGTGYFPDEATNPGGKPWSNQSPTVSFNFLHQSTIETNGQMNDDINRYFDGTAQWNT